MPSPQSVEWLKQGNKPIITFEEKADVVLKEINKRRGKWQLKAVAWIDYDDIALIILNHIYKQWAKWDQSRPLEPWLNRVISHQLTNQLRNNYTSCVRPCVGLNCAANEGGDSCSITKSGKQCSECPIYRNWELKKKAAFDTKLPVSIENHQQEVFDLPEQSYDIEKIAADIHEKMKLAISPSEYKVYKALFVDFLSEEETAKIMGYRTSERNRKVGYRRIKQIRKKIIERVKKLTPDYFS